MSELFAESETKKLKLRLLSGSVLVAFLSSAIFLAIAYRLASDMGQDIYQKTAVNEANTILELVQAQTSTDHVNQSPEPPKILHQLFASKDFDAVYLQLKRGNQAFTEGVDPLGDPSSARLPDSADDWNTARIVEVSGKLFVQAKVQSTDQTLQIRLTKPLDKVQAALHQLSRRLTLASLLVLWLAVWAALIVTGIIAKRITEARDRLVYEATHDALTGLGNRMLFLDRHKRLVEERRANDDVSPAALLIIDLDNFKEVNDTAGPDVGDQLLIQIAERLQGGLPAGSELFRYGGDEFAIWLDEFDESQSRQFAEIAVDLCHQTTKIDDWSFGIGASAGVARLPDDGNTLKELLRCADIALHQAKRLRCGVSFFTSSNDPDKELKIALRSQLHQAISENQFVLFYQPKVNLQDHQIRGVEALARWVHPIHGLLPPYLFIDLIEQGGVVNLFSRYVLRQAIRQLRDWLDQGREIPIAVNLSSYNLLDVSLVDYIRDTLKEMRVPGRLLEIELTESAAMLDVASAQEIFGLLHPEGIKVSIDDFGTGMSSLAYLKTLDVDYIKIDRSFISKLENSDTDQAIVTCMIDLCRNLHKQVIAEGVETAEQAELLLSMGCDQAQGYFFSKPVPAGDLRLRDKMGAA
jgi:diguanylate cyclase (GGDEF)-like protein